LLFNVKWEWMNRKIHMRCQKFRQGLESGQTSPNMSRKNILRNIKGGVGTLRKGARDKEKPKHKPTGHHKHTNTGESTGKAATKRPYN